MPSDVAEEGKVALASESLNPCAQAKYTEFLALVLKRTENDWLRDNGFTLWADNKLIMIYTHKATSQDMSSGGGEVKLTDILSGPMTSDRY